jgi:hypothetical protein
MDTPKSRNVTITAEHEDNAHLNPSYDVRLTPLFGATGADDFNGYLIMLDITSFSHVEGAEDVRTSTTLACPRREKETPQQTLVRALFMMSAVVASANEGVVNQTTTHPELN